MIITKGEVLNMNIGEIIKINRTKKAMSQADLAEVFHVSAQSISKWENGTSQPDINQLPSIASFFGITIDELFAYPTDLEYERIENAIDNGYPFSNEQFIHSENFLLEEIKRDPSKHKAVSMLGDLYLFESCRLADKAAHYAKDALQLKPDNKFDLNTLNNSMGGCKRDWNVESHTKLIRELKNLIKTNPDLSRTKLYLLDNLIEDGRYSEAEELIAEMGDFKSKIIYDLWIKERKFGFDAVRKDYEMLLANDTLDWAIYADAADRLAYNMEYKLAISAYEKAHEVAPKPRYVDMLQSIRMLAGILGDHKKVVETCKRELTLLEEEWNMTKGQQVDHLNELIKKHSAIV
jgi:transcriptional regulator with XRE-family HTH domain